MGRTTYGRLDLGIVEAETLKKALGAFIRKRTFKRQPAKVQEAARNMFASASNIVEQYGYAGALE